jgi:hypothetical protein
VELGFSRLFENRVMRRIYGPMREEAAEGWRRVHNGELHNLYALPIIQVIEMTRMRGAGHIEHMGEMRNACTILVRKPEGKNHLEDLGIDGRTVLEWTLEKQGGKL